MSIFFYLHTGIYYVYYSYIKTYIHVHQVFFRQNTLPHICYTKYLCIRNVYSKTKIKQNVRYRTDYPIWTLSRILFLMLALKCWITVKSAYVFLSHTNEKEREGDSYYSNFGALFQHCKMANKTIFVIKNNWEYVVNTS